jgi:outer membrane receptor for ferrienterochelin and colicin
MKRIILIPILVMSALLFTQCASQSPGGQDLPKKGFEQYTSLFQALRSIGGITVSGTESNPNIILRGGGGGGMASVQPLFLIDNIVIGTNYSQVNSLVIPSNIESIRILGGVSATNQYGQEARGGVIKITTKAAN